MVQLNSNLPQRILKYQEQKRNEYSERIVSSPHPKKVVVAGPGTGKTWIFERVLKSKGGNCLAITFINNLADKLSHNLASLAICCTFHGFCFKMFSSLNKKRQSTTTCAQLDRLIQSDAQFIIGKKIYFSRRFRNLEISDEEIKFYFKRSDYYNAVCFDDVVFRIYEYLKEKPQEIPSFDQVVVDEFQDFNKLEVEFIDLLSSKNHVLITGDDDQALYSELRQASPSYLREKWRSGNYEKFKLPYCSRSPQAIVGASNDIIKNAQRIGKLAGRIDKEFRCYLPDRRTDSINYPTIEKVACACQSKRAPYIAKFITKELKSISDKEIKNVNENCDFTALITGPGHYLRQIAEFLEREGIDSINFEREDPRRTNILEAYELLEKNSSSNLAWRLICEQDPIDNREEIIARTINSRFPRLLSLLPKTYVKKHVSVLKILSKLKEGESLKTEEKKILENVLRLNFKRIKDFLKEGAQAQRAIRQGDSITVKLTTYMGCKGLSAGYVFILGLNEGILPKSNENPKDLEICLFNVALTRTFKKCYLVSTYRFAGKKEGRPSIFIDWIDKRRLRSLFIDKNYWRKCSEQKRV